MNRPFDIPRAEHLRDQGMEAAAEARSEALELAREIAVRLGQQSTDGITADDVFWILNQERPDLAIMLGNAAGSVFRGKEWRTYGEFQLSKRASRHRSVQRVWYYEPNKV